MARHRKTYADAIRQIAETGIVDPAMIDQPQKILGISAAQFLRGPGAGGAGVSRRHPDGLSSEELADNLQAKLNAK